MSAVNVTSRNTKDLRKNLLILKSEIQIIFEFTKFLQSSLFGIFARLSNIRNAGDEAIMIVEAT